MSDVYITIRKQQLKIYMAACTYRLTGQGTEYVHILLTLFQHPLLKKENIKERKTVKIVEKKEKAKSKVKKQKWIEYLESRLHSK